MDILDLYKHGAEAAIYFKIFRDRTLGCSKEFVYFSSDSSCLVTICPWTWFPWIRGGYLSQSFQLLLIIIATTLSTATNKKNLLGFKTALIYKYMHISSSMHEFKMRAVMIKNLRFNDKEFEICTTSLEFESGCTSFIRIQGNQNFTRSPEP